MPLTVSLKNTMVHVHNNNINLPQINIVLLLSHPKIWQYQSSFVNIKYILLHTINVKHSNQHSFKTIDKHEGHLTL